MCSNAKDAGASFVGDFDTGCEWLLGAEQVMWEELTKVARTSSVPKVQASDAPPLRNPMPSTNRGGVLSSSAPPTSSAAARLSAHGR